MSNPNNSKPQGTEWLKDLGLSDRDTACLVLPDLDYDAQLMAIHYLLQRHREVETALQNDIKKLDECARQASGIRNETAVNDWLEHVHGSVYQDAAHSMAAVGMLAPLIESIFYQGFQGIGDKLQSEQEATAQHERWQQATQNQWDCHFTWNKGRRCSNLVEGIMQLADAVSLAPYLPGDLKPTLQALFEYRNK